MPFVDVKVAGPLTKEQRKQIASRITAALKEVAGKDPKSTNIVFSEIPRDMWALGENLLAE